MSLSASGVFFPVCTQIISCLVKAQSELAFDDKNISSIKGGNLRSNRQLCGHAKRKVLSFAMLNNRRLSLNKGEEKRKGTKGR